jgi:hypothetical protein
VLPNATPARRLRDRTRATEYAEVMAVRYRVADRRQRTALLDEYCRTTGCHRKAAVRRLHRRGPGRYTVVPSETSVADRSTSGLGIKRALLAGVVADDPRPGPSRDG